MGVLRGSSSLPPSTSRRHARAEGRPYFFPDTEVFWAEATMSHSLRCSASRPPLLRPQQGRAQEGCHHTPHSLSVSSPKEDTGQAQGFREQQVVPFLALCSFSSAPSITEKEQKPNHTQFLSRLSFSMHGWRNLFFFFLHERRGDRLKWSRLGKKLG